MRFRWFLPLLGLLLLFTGCVRQQKVSEELARRMITHRTLGLAYLEESKLSEAAGEFRTLIDIAPREPLGYANLGLTYLRMGEFGQADSILREALDLAPNNPDIVLILAKVYEVSNQGEEAIQVLERSRNANPEHVRTLYELAQFYENSKESQAPRRAEELLIRVADARPGNLAARLQLVETLLRNGKPDAALQHMEQIRQIVPELPAGSMEIFQRAVAMMRSGEAGQAFTPARIFHNLLKSTDFYQAAITELRGIGGPITGTPILQFSSDVSAGLEVVQGIPSALSFTDVSENTGFGSAIPEHPSETGRAHSALIHADYDGDGDQDVYFSRWDDSQSDGEAWLFRNENGTFEDVAEPAGVGHPGRDKDADFADFNNDGYLDLFLLTTDGPLLYQNQGDGTFVEISDSVGITTDGNGEKALIADLDMDGDLDIFIAGTKENYLFRNNLDGTFRNVAKEVGVAGPAEESLDAGYGDFDDDGDLDIFLSNQTGSRLYTNLRQSYFNEITEEVNLGTSGGSGAAAIADYNNDGYLDIFVGGSQEGFTLYRNNQDGTFQPDTRSGEALRLLQDVDINDLQFFDYDNDGYLDLLTAGEVTSKADTQRGLLLFHNSENGTFKDGSGALPVEFSEALNASVADYDGDGDLDIFAATADGNLHLLRNDGGNTHNFLQVKLTGLRTGSSKNNYFGIGAKVEVKAGAFYQMRVMREPVEHFGLGLHQDADVVRVVWSNGVPQNRFNTERNQTIVENQILKGSCPWLYAWNGKKYEFVTDVLWASALGMPVGIMGDDTGFQYSFAQSTDEYLKIPGTALHPRDGNYLLQFTDELWETPYVDQVQLIAVDHPSETDVYVNEKFTPPPFPSFRIYQVQDRRLPVKATDGRGNDVRDAITEQDGRYVSGLTPARYQGIMELHELLLDLGEVAPQDSITLFLHGWVFPTDASINVAMAQSEHQQSIAPSVQVINQDGQWQTAIESLGFPKG
ncbi:MAG TPA: FG-GAP-like repeat-containing protein, partial [bacterium]|nr:FG-GAP-like repeat-containing protein [bacterium]